MIRQSRRASALFDEVQIIAEVKIIFSAGKRSTSYVVKINGHPTAHGRYENVEAMRVTSLQNLVKLIPDKDGKDDRYDMRHAIWEMSTYYAQQSARDSENLPPSYSVYDKG